MAVTLGKPLALLSLVAFSSCMANLATDCTRIPVYEPAYFPNANTFAQQNLNVYSLG